MTKEEAQAIAVNKNKSILQRLNAVIDYLFGDNADAVEVLTARDEEYFDYLIKISQSGTSAPTFTVLDSEKYEGDPITFTAAYSSTGTYTLTADNGVVGDLVTTSVVLADSSDDVLEIRKSSNTVLTLTTRRAGTLTNGLMTNVVVPIRIKI